MAKVVYTDWKDRQFEPEIIGVYEEDDDGYKARAVKEDELKEEYDIDEEVRVWIEEIEIHRNTTITQSEIDLVMNALAGHPVVTSANFANKVQKILENYL